MDDLKQCPHCGKDLYKPDRISIFWMWDGHVFSELKGKTLDEITKEACKFESEDHYGTLCGPILLQGKREIRRLISVGGRGSSDVVRWQNELKNWCLAVVNDPDAIRLIGDRFEP